MTLARRLRDLIAHARAGHRIGQAIADRRTLRAALVAAEAQRDAALDRDEFLWELLMTCNDCGHREVEHVDARCVECSCDNSDRGGSWRVDEGLLARDAAYREAGG